MSRLVFRSSMPAVPAQLWRWHARPGAFERLVPPWQDVRVIDRTGGIEDGARLYMRLAAGPLRIRWVAEHREGVEGCEFTDVQLHGPFAHWRHRHRFLASATVQGQDALPGLLSDEIEYRLPLEPVSRWAAGGAVVRDLERMFAFRHERTRRDLRRHATGQGRRLRVAVSGSSGLIGTALCAFLTTGGHEVVRLVRRPTRTRLDGTREVRWDPAAGRLDRAALDGVDALVHLAGAPVAGRRWSAAQREAILRSRVDGTTVLSRALAGSAGGPRTLIAASGVGFYGDRREAVDEESPAGNGFLAATARAWEAATQPAAAAGVRVVTLRLGTVLAARGGMVRRLLPLFRLGLGGTLGPGTQPVSWISLDDAVGLIHQCLLDDRIEGPINAVAPVPTTQAGLARALAAALRRPAAVRYPAWMVRALAGEMAEALVLGGAPVRSSRLGEIGFEHQDPDPVSALSLELGSRRMSAEDG